jgi:hypothetical protein
MERNVKSAFMETNHRSQAKGVLKNPLLHVLSILLLGLLAYSNTIDVPFYFDDTYVIVTNDRIKDPSNIPSLFWRMEGPIATRPFTLATLAFNHVLGGLSTRGYHIFNVALHLINGVMLYMLLLRTAGLMGAYGRNAGGVAFFSSLLFVLHPVQTEAVTYIVSRSVLLCTFFYLLGITLFISVVRSRRGRAAYMAALLLSSMLGMSSREDFVTFPLMLLLFDFFFISGGNVKGVLGRWKIHLPVISTAAFLIYMVMSFDYEDHAGLGIGSLTPLKYLMTQFSVHWTYLRLLLLPIKLNLDYDYPLAVSFFQVRTLVSFAGYLALWALAALTMKRHPIVSFCVLWFLIILGPTSSVITLSDYITEHRLYLPSIGFFVIFTAAILGLPLGKSSLPLRNSGA